MKKPVFTDKHALPILAVIMVCTFPHLFNISMWTVVSCLLMWAYIYGAARNSWRLPGRVVRLILVTIFFVLSMTTNEGFTIEAFVALLALMICMKLLDIRDDRNRMTTVILCYFLIVGSLFFDDSMYATVYMFFSVLCTTAVLMYINQTDLKPAAYMKFTGKLMIQAFPIMVLLFLLFPRIQGGMWGRAPILSGKPGFSDRMSFGDISEMAKNTDVAFRVEFEDRIPPRDQLYWRGVVLWDFDGHTWHRGVGRRGSFPKRSVASDKIKYTLTLEPHNEQWLITLDLPMRISQRRAWLLDDFSYYRWRHVTQRIEYQGESYLDGKDAEKNSFGRNGLELPEDINPRARELARNMYAEEGNVQDFIHRTFNYFSEQPFFYSLNPPPLTPGDNNNEGSVMAGNLVDSFLFETRKGFCEHYATAFAFLMRAAGVPARIVVGYLGGTLNRYGGYMVVRQSQAHAWCEVWVAEKGWVRVDPTAAVAPMRIEGDINDAVPESEFIGLASYVRGTPFEPWLEPLASALDLMNSRWNKWVMGYTAFEQTDLFSRFGINLESGAGPVKAFVTALVVMAAAALALSFVLLRRNRPHQDPLSLAWQEFCLKLAKNGLARKPAQGPVDYMRYVIRNRPDLEAKVRVIVSMYVKHRYGGNVDGKEAERLRNIVKQFYPRTSRT